VQTTENGVTVSLENGKEIEAELLLVAVGRGPVSQGLGYEEAGVAMVRRYWSTRTYPRSMATPASS